MTIVFLLDVYYCVIVSWTLFYLFSCFVSLPSLPWEGCGKFSSVCSQQILTWYSYVWNNFLDHWWNSENCKPDEVSLNSPNHTTGFITNNVTNLSSLDVTRIKSITPAEEFWRYYTFDLVIFFISDGQ